MKQKTLSNYRVIDQRDYYRRDVLRHFSKDCRCSISMTARVNVTALVRHSQTTGSKFYINFLYILSTVLNSVEDYKMGYLWQTKELVCYDLVHPVHYVFYDDTRTCTPVYSIFDADYQTFYEHVSADIQRAKVNRGYHLDSEHHPNWFDASYIAWLSYDALNIELPDGHLHFAPIINWGRYRSEDHRIVMPVSVRLNHAIADGFLVANVFRLLEQHIIHFCSIGYGK